MTALSRHPLVERIAYHLARARAWARRATAVGLAVRGAIYLSGAAALGLALAPVAGPASALPVAVVAALPPAAAPRTGGVWLLELAAVAATTVAVAGDATVPLPALIALGALLYLHHTAAALGAQLRTDAVVPAAVFRHWAGRAALVVVVSVPVILAIAALTGAAPDWPATGYLALGVLAALAVAAALCVDLGLIQPDSSDSGLDNS
jgi:hypothetical protein